MVGTRDRDSARGGAFALAGSMLPRCSLRFVVPVLAVTCPDNGSLTNPQVTPDVRHDDDQLHVLGHATRTTPARRRPRSASTSAMAPPDRRLNLASGNLATGGGVLADADVRDQRDAQLHRPGHARDAAGARADLRGLGGSFTVGPAADPDPTPTADPKAHAEADPQAHAEADPQAHAEADAPADRKPDPRRSRRRRRSGPRPGRRRSRPRSRRSRPRSRRPRRARRDPRRRSECVAVADGRRGGGRSRDPPDAVRPDSGRPAAVARRGWGGDDRWRVRRVVREWLAAGGHRHRSWRRRDGQPLLRLADRQRRWRPVLHAPDASLRQREEDGEGALLFASPMPASMGDARPAPPAPVVAAAAAAAAAPSTKRPPAAEKPAKRTKAAAAKTEARPRRRGVEEGAAKAAPPCSRTPSRPSRRDPPTARSPRRRSPSMTTRRSASAKNAAAERAAATGAAAAAAPRGTDRRRQDSTSRPPRASSG